MPSSDASAARESKTVWLDSSGGFHFHNSRNKIVWALSTRTTSAFFTEAYAAAMSSTIRVAAAILASYGAGLFGYLFIDSQVSSWYASLLKPAFTPSDSTFVIIWFVLYAAMAAALAFVWTKKPPAAHTDGWVRFFFVQLLFNASYTMFFFGFHAILVAFIDILFLGFIVLSLTASAADIDRRAFYLMLLYFFWIVFAGYLTLGVWWLN